MMILTMMIEIFTGSNMHITRTLASTPKHPCIFLTSQVESEGNLPMTYAWIPWAAIPLFIESSHIFSIYLKIYTMHIYIHLYININRLANR